MAELATLILLLFLSGVFSGSETALVALSIARVEGLVAEGRRGARALHRLKSDPSRMLTTILIGNNVVNIAASVMATVLATRWLGDAGPGVAVGVLTIVILVFGEITPKSLATRYAERISLIIAPPLLAFMRLIHPLVWIFGHVTSWAHRLTGTTRDPTVTESELIKMLGHGEEEGTIEHSERELIERVFAFHDLKVRDVMTPMSEVSVLEGSQSVAQALPRVADGTFTRIPLYDEDVSNVNKVLYLRDLLTAVASGRDQDRIDSIAHDPLFVPQYLPIDELFAKLLRQRTHLAMVVDEFGVIRGIVTVEDLLEELVGEIYDESDVAPTVAKRVSEDELVVDGAGELRIVEEMFGIDLPGKPTDTVSFWVLTHTGSIPDERTSFSIDGLQVEICAASPRRIDQVRIRRPPLESDDAARGDGQQSSDE